MVNRVVLITGAGGGLGSSAACCLMHDGLVVVGIGKSIEDTTDEMLDLFIDPLALLLPLFCALPVT